MKKYVFDEILKENAIKSVGEDVFGYDKENHYPRHFRPDVFDEFISDMMRNYPLHYEKYAAGKGSELRQQGKTPPKMASVASSSRFCYIALRDGADALGGKGEVDFEHECPIDGIIGTAPQMDAYVKKGNIFAEVKCHEIFDSHKTLLSKQYFDCLFGKDNDFGLEPIQKERMAEYGIKEDGRCFEIPFEILKISAPEMIDFKQLLCHLLGVKSHKEQNEEATLVYLFFKPKADEQKLRDEIDSLFEKLKEEIEEIFGDEKSPIKKFAEKNSITLKAVAQYSYVMAPLTADNMIYLYP